MLIIINKKVLLSVFYSLMNLIGVIPFFYFLNRKKHLVLTYHHVIPDELFDNTVHLGVSHRASIFEKQIQLIKKHFSTKQCLITFDDGYQNQLLVAAKLLEKHDLKGVFFISFESVYSSNALTIDKILLWVSCVPCGRYQILDEFLEINDNNRSSIASHIYEKLKKNSHYWDEIENSLNHQFSFEKLTISHLLFHLRFKPLDYNQLKILREQGHIVASHSWSHRPLATLSIESQKKDFEMCAFHARQHCNSMLYSYPFGGLDEVSPVTAQLCKAHGFSGAYMNIEESPAWKEVDSNYRLQRISLPNESNFYLLNAKLSGFEPFLKKCMRKMKNGKKYLSCLAKSMVCQKN